MRVGQSVAVRWMLGLALALAGTGASWAAPVPGFTPAPSGGGDVLAHTGYSAQACFDNLSPADTGYAPTLQVVVPAGSTLQSASAGGFGQTVETIGTCSAAGGCPTGFVNPDTGVTVPLAEGETLAVVRYALGAMAPALPAVCTDLALALGDTVAAPIDLTRALQLTPIFSFGADALDNPATDAPISGATATVPVTPRLIVVRKSIDAPEGETATGPNFARTVRLEVGIANGAVIAPLNVFDALPDTLQYVAGSAVLTGCTGSITDTGTPSGATPGGTVGRECATITGAGAPGQLVLQFSAFVAQDDAGGTPVITAGSPTRSIVNTGQAAGTYDPPGSDPPGPATGSGNATLTAKLAPIRKTVAVASDPGGDGPTRGDLLRYTLTYDVSDYFSVALAGPGALTLTDVLGDGQTFQGCADAGTTISAFANGTTLAPAPLGGGACSDTGKDPVTGKTTITFNAGVALTGTFGLSLHGDLANDAIQSGPTRVVVTFLARIDDAYSANPFPGPGDPSIGLRDTVGNDVSTATTSNGQASSDSSSATTTIGSGTLQKTVYAYNGIVPPPANFLVAPGDTVTYRLRLERSSEAFEQGRISDYLPSPLFRVTGFQTAGEAAIAGTGTPPAAGRWTTGPDDDATTIGAIVADVAPIVTTSAANEAITWDYGSVTTANGRIMDLLLTVEATDEPFGDGLSFTNVAAVTFQNSTGDQDLAISNAQVQTRAPRVTIRKAIVASSNPACVTATPPANYDSARSGCDASDTVDFRLTLENGGRSPAYNVRVDDSANPAAGLSACTLLSVQDGNGATVATTGSLFDTSASGGLVIATIPADGDSAVLPGERLVIDYRCTIPANALPLLPDRRIDNTARLRYFSNEPSHVSDPEFNFAANQQFPGPNVRRARIAVANVTALTKAITASSLPQTTTPNINAGETLTFLLTLNLAEGEYQNVSFTDSAFALPPVNCATPGYTCSANVTVAGATLVVTPTPQTTTGVITYTYSQQKSASGTNTVSFQAQNVPVRTATSSWTVGNPAPAVTKQFNPTSADASDTVQIRLGWSNGNAANPMFQCVITDPIDIVNFDPGTLVAVTTPAGYAVSLDTTTGLITYTATSTTTPCPDVPVGGALVQVGLRATAIAGGSVNNVATLAGNTLPSDQSGGQPVGASGSALLALGSPAIDTKVIASTTEPDAVTAGNLVAIGERVVYRVTYTLPDGLSRAVRLVDEMQGGLANMTYIAGSARLSRNTAALVSATDPGGINGAAPGTFVAVTPQCVGVAPCTANQVRFDLGDVANDPATGGATDRYTLEIAFQTSNVTANAMNVTRNNRGQVVYRPQGSASDQTLNGGQVAVRVVSPVVRVNKVVAQQLDPGNNTITYTLTIANTATGAGAGPAFDWTFSDTLPATLTNPQLVTPLPPGVTASFAGHLLTGTVARLDPGQQAVVSYTASVDPATATGTTIANAAGTQATSLPGPNGTGGATPGTPGATNGERTGTGGVNNLGDATAAPFTLQRLGIVKTRTSAATGYAIGDEVEYEVRLSSPLGTTQSVVVTDTLPVGLAYVTGSASLTTTGGPIATSLPGIPATVAGNVVTFDFGTLTATTAGEIVLRYRAIVRNVLSNQRYTQLANSVAVTYFDSVTSQPITVTAANPPVITVEEPNLDVTKNIVAGGVGAEAGDNVDFELVIANNGSSIAHRVDIRDVLPAGLFQIANVALTATGDAFLEGTATLVATSHAHVVTTTSTNDTLDLAQAGPDGTDYLQLAPGASVTLTFRAILMDTVVPGQTIVNVLRVPYASQSACPSNPECRDGSGVLADDDNDAILNNYVDSDSASLVVNDSVAVTKRALPEKAAVGEVVSFRHRIHLIEGTTPALSFTDVMPPGMTYVAHTIAVGSLGMTLGNPAYDTRQGTGSTVRFDLGDVVNPANGVATDDFVDIEIEARVDNIAPNQDGTLLRNGEEADGSSVFVTYGSGPSTVYFDADPDTPGRQGRVVTVIEPQLALAKTALPASQALGANVVFKLDVSHLPTSTADAFDVRVVDTLPAGLTFVPGSVIPAGALVSAAGQVLTFDLGALTRAAGSTSVVFNAQIDPSATVDVPLVNQAHLTWASTAGATGAADSGRNGTGDLNDYFTDASASVVPNANASVDATKTVAIAIDADASGDLTPGDTLEYTVTLVNGTTPLTNVVFTDSTPVNTTYVAGSATTTAGTVTGSNPLVVTIGPMGPGATVTIRFRVTVNAGTPAGTLIRNQGVVTSAETVPELTDWDGNDANGDQPTDIYVGGGIPPGSLLRALKSVALVQDADSSGSITQGDRMRYTIELRNAGTTPLTAVSLTDTIPADLAYVAGSATATQGTITITGQAVAWDSILLLASGASTTATFDVTIVSVTPPTQAYVNQGTATSTQTGSVLTDGNTSLVDGAQPTIFHATAGGAVDPVLDAQKRWSLAIDATPPSGVPSPGDTLLYTITVTNFGPVPATNVRLVDPTPNCTGALDPCTTYVAGSLTTSQGAIVGTAPIEVNLGTLAVGATANITFQVLVDTTTATRVIVANQARITRDGSLLPLLTDDNGNAADGRNPTLTPIVTVGTNDAGSLRKTLEGSSEPDDITPGTDAVIGEVMRYRVAFDINAGTTLDVAIRDTLPPGLHYLPGSARLARTFDTGLQASANPGSINSAASGTFVPLPDGTGIAIGSTPGGASTLTVTLGDVINSDADLDAESYVLEYRAVVANVPENQAGVAAINSATVTWRDALLQPQALAPAVVRLVVQEPQVGITLAVSPGILGTVGGSVRYTIVVRNAAPAAATAGSVAKAGSNSVSPAFDLEIRDVLPSIFTSKTVESITSSGASGVVNLSPDTTVRINAARLDPGGSITIVVLATAPGLLPAQPVSNTATVAFTSLPGSHGSTADGVATPGAPGSTAGERIDTGGVNDYVAEASTNLLVQDPVVNIPTLSEWALAMLVLLVMMVAAGTRRRRA